MPKRGSDAVSDWPLLNMADGASWVLGKGVRDNFWCGKRCQGQFLAETVAAKLILTAKLNGKQGAECTFLKRSL